MVLSCKDKAVSKFKWKNKPQLILLRPVICIKFQKRFYVNKIVGNSLDMIEFYDSWPL